MPEQLTGKKTGSTIFVWIYFLLCITGISFCFFLGFPFWHHNESYLWVVAFSKTTLWDALTRQIIKIESFRPLGMANAWLNYTLSGNIYVQELCNWLFAAASFGLLFYYSLNKAVFAWLALFTGSFFFAGYLYLFHLHGVFYGPFQLYLVILTVIAIRKQRLTGKILAATALLTLLIAFYHTFALLMYCAFLAGYTWQNFGSNSRTAWLLPLLAIVPTLALGEWILHSHAMHSMGYMFQGLLTSYCISEPNKLSSLLAGLLTIITVYPAFGKPRVGAIAGITSAAMGIMFMLLGWPVLLLWLGSCLVKLIAGRQWVLAALLAGALVLPLGSGSGSPTYTVFAIMLGTFITASDKRFSGFNPVFLQAAAAVAVGIALCSGLVIKTGVAVPVVSKLATPVLAEQEKTFQMRDIITWKRQNREYANYQLVFADDWAMPVNTQDNQLRKNRPVTEQSYLDTYLGLFPGAADSSNRLYITFGNKTLTNKTLVFSVKGRWNGQACVFQ